MTDLETVIDKIIERHPNDSGRPQPLENYLITRSFILVAKDPALF